MEFLAGWLRDFVEFEPFPETAAAREQLDWIEHLAGALTSCGLAVEGHRLVESREAARFDEVVLDVEVTSNRPDAMCHFGLARELAVALGVPLRQPEVPFYGSHSTDGSAGNVVLEDFEGCPRYVARVIRGVSVGRSPDWLRRRLEAIGLRSINNVVDATNYVLWETGQPLHAFDLATVPGGEIHVRRALAGERLTTLDGVDRELDPEVLVIADRKRAIALAGVMGGADTEVTATTTDVLLESAHFDRRRIRIGAKRLGLHTDASHRFERGADFEICDEASRRCATLLVEIAGGTVEEDAVDAIARRPRTIRWQLDEADLARFAGLGVAGEECERILSGLGFAPSGFGEGVWEGVVPSWREPDFEPRRGRDELQAYPQDVWEEVLRHVGFDRLPATLPTIGGTDEGRQEDHDRGTRLRRLLAGCGYAESIHFAFHDPAWDGRYPASARVGEPLALANPLSERLAVLRRSLVPNLAQAAELNARRGASGVRLFEVGHVFPGGDEPELEAIAWVAGGAVGEAWDRPIAADLLTIKGIGEAVSEELSLDGLIAEPANLPGVVAGAGAQWRVAGEVVGWFGQLESDEAAFAVYAGELLLGRLPSSPRVRTVTAPARLPGIRADLTLTHALSLSWSELAAAIGDRMRPPLVGFALKERYRGAGLPAGAVATTITLDYHGGERTLTQEEVNERQKELAQELERRFAISREGGA